ncbi:PKD domain-containing protein [Tenacibaculum crassostreae]|uniref:PKD domain-containing protein n=1 Tax=Tenacibaculum crassostreae TaxID=502683 RepID=UPI003894F1BF
MGMKTTHLKKLIFIVLLLYGNVMFSQTTVSMQAPCNISGCGAQDVEIGRVYIGDINGDQITTCTVGDVLNDVYLYVDISKAASKIDLYMQFYLMNGSDKIDKDGNVYVGNQKISIGISGSITTGTYQMFELINYTCGEELTLTDVYLSWQTPGSVVGPGCATQQSKCSGENLPPIDVQTPIAPDFTFVYNCENNGFQGATFTNASTGGDGVLTYQWSFGTGSSPSVANTEGPHIVQYTSSGTKTVTLTVTDEDGDFNSITKNVVIDSTPLASIIGTNVKCNGGSDGAVDLTVTGGKTPYTYSWSSGETTEDINNLSIGSYTVTVTDANNCTSNATIEITEPTVLSTSYLASDLSCGGSDGAIDLSVSGGTAPYTYLWNTGATTEDISGLTAGTYTVTVTDTNGCQQVESVTLISNDNEDPTISVPEMLSIEGCNEDDISSLNSRYPFSLTESSDIKDSFFATDYIASDDGTIVSITYIDVVASYNGCITTVTRTFTVTDTCGKKGTDTLIITITDTTNPTWTNEPMDMTSVECDPSTNAQAFSDWLASFSGTDSCGTAAVTHNSTGLSDDCGGTGSETVTFTLTDECGNSITKDATFTIIDTTDPTWTNEPMDMTSVECDPSTNAQAFSDWLASFSGTDSCGTAAVTHNSTGLSDDCGGTGSETVTFTLTDECGNSITKDATFTIIDTTDPTWTNEPMDMTSVECDPSTNAQAFSDWLASFSGTDSCGTAAVTHNSTGLSDDCGGTGSETVTFTLTDECGNSITKDATFTIIDTTDPTWTNEPMDMTSVECDPSTNAQAFSDWLASFSGNR